MICNIVIFGNDHRKNPIKQSKTPTTKKPHNRQKPPINIKIHTKYLKITYPKYIMDVIPHIDIRHVNRSRAVNAYIHQKNHHI